MKVLHCVAGKLYGGVESFLETLAACRDITPNVEHEFAVCFEGRLSRELEREGAAPHRLGEVRFGRPWTAWRARRRLAGLLRRRDIGVVATHGCWAQALCGRSAKQAGRPLVFWMHDMIHGSHWVDRLAARVEPDLVLVNSLATAETLPRLYPQAPYQVLRYPVRGGAVDRREARETIRAEMDVSTSEVIIVTACRLERWKGHTLLIEALGRLKEKAGWTAWIAGGVQRPHEQVYLAELMAAAKVAGIEGRVRFLGQREDVPKVLAAADIHCQPNTGPEPFGIAFVEALQAGLPVLTTRMGGAVEIVTEACGILVPPGDAVALAEACSRLIDEPALRNRLGAAGPARAAEICGPGVVLPRLETVLSSLTSNG